MRYGIKIISIILLVLLSTGCSFLVSYEGSYKGRVIDAETKQPIEGVVALGVWYSETPTVAGVVGKYYDAKETVTNNKGEFEIQGQGLKMFSNLSEMHVLIFKAGYEYIGSGPWRSFKIDEIYRKKIAWEGDRAIIPLRKLTMEERSQSSTFPDSPPSQASEAKIKLMMREIKEERKGRGLD